MAVDQGSSGRQVPGGDSVTRGAIRPTTRSEAVDRALRMLRAVPIPPDPTVTDSGNRPIAYRLSESNGGRDPFASHCADWSYGGRTPTSDCIGLVLWASGIDRLQPGFQGTRGHWLNCHSLMFDAAGEGKFCQLVKNQYEAIAGDWLLTDDHIAMILRPALRRTDGSQRFDHLVIDCSPRHGRDTAIGIGAPWSDACVVARYVRYTV